MHCRSGSCRKSPMTCVRTEGSGPPSKGGLRAARFILVLLLGRLPTSSGAAPVPLDAVLPPCRCWTCCSRRSAALPGQFLEYLPNLAFLVILVLVARLRPQPPARLLPGVQRSRISFTGFDRTGRSRRTSLHGSPSLRSLLWWPTPTSGSESPAFKACHSSSASFSRSAPRRR